MWRNKDLVQMILLRLAFLLLRHAKTGATAYCGGLCATFHINPISFSSVLR